MLTRLQRNEEPLNLACHHLEEYLETKVRARNLKWSSQFMSAQGIPLKSDLGSEQGSTTYRRASDWI